MSFLSCILLLLAVHVSHASFVLHLGAEGEQCFVLRAPANSLIAGNFDVLDDHLSAIPIVVKILQDETMDTVYVSEKGVSEDNFRVQLDQGGGGRYYVCIQNGIDRESYDELDRTVGLDVRVVVPSAGSKTSSAAQQLADRAESLQEKLWDLQDHFDYMRNREASHRETTEQTFTNVVRWSLLEFAVLLGIAIAQIVALRVFFERKRYI